MAESLQTLIKDLFGLLQEEYRCLLDNDIESLEALASRKVHLVEMVEEAFDERTASEEAMGADEIDLLDACQRQNNTNGYLLASRRNLVNALLLTLSAGSEEPLVYTASGNYTLSFKGMGKGIA
jgi:flagellar biosynthesis/type III secretory pathway chaperone